MSRREDIVLFIIEEVSGRPRLWRRSHPEYKKNALRKRDWREILDNIRVAFSDDPDGLAESKMDTVQGLARAWAAVQLKHTKLYEDSGEFVSDIKCMYAK